MPLTVLIVGFGPFPGQKQNPTGPLVTQLARMRRPAKSEARRIACVLPTTFAAVENRLSSELERHRPDVVLMFGLAVRTPHLRIERRARNALGGLLPDAEGKRPARRVTDGRFDAAIMARAPAPALLRAAAKARVPARLSYDAGRYICNLAYWRALSFHQAGARPLVQFVHVPGLPSPSRPSRRPSKRGISSAALQRAAEAMLGVLIARARTRRG